MQISIKTDVKKVSRYISGIHNRQVPFATSQALNDIAMMARKEVMDKMARYIDRPTPWTKKGIAYKRSNKRTLFAEVLILSNRWEYLKHQVEGGRRRPNNRAIAVPVNQRKNKYGNMTRGAVAKLLAQPNVYSGKVNGVPGIYKRVGGVRNPRVKLLVYWINEADYKKRFPFHKIVNQVVVRHFKQTFDRRLTAAIRSAK